MSDLQVIGLVTVVGMLVAASAVSALVCGAEDWWHQDVRPEDPHPWMKADKDEMERVYRERKERNG